jgi:hypothetical protein
MIAPCRAVDSIRACGRMNLIQALSATLAGQHRLAAHHRRVAMQCRAEAWELRRTASH